MKKILVFVFVLMIFCLSFACYFGASMETGEFVHSDSPNNWEKGLCLSDDGRWTYEWYARDTGTFTSMQWCSEAGGYYEAQYKEAISSDPYWYCRIRRFGRELHPGTLADAVLTFLCPMDGTVEFTVTLERMGYEFTEYNGNTIRIMLNDQIIPFNQGSNDVEELQFNTRSMDISIEVAVKDGDCLRLMIGSQGERSNDAVSLTYPAKVKYLSGPNLPEKLQPHTIVCAGDSIVSGPYGTQKTQSYAAVLQKKLKDAGVENVSVLNCGGKSATAISGNSYSFFSGGGYQKSITENPDIVILSLGTYDSTEALWDAEEYKKSYRELINAYLKLPQKPTVYLAYPTYVADPTKTDCRRNIIQNEIIPIQFELAKELGLKIIDLNTLTRTFAASYSDGIHPDKMLHEEMATYIYNALCMDYSMGLTPEDCRGKGDILDPAKYYPPSSNEDSLSTSVDKESNTSVGRNNSSTLLPNGAVLWAIIGGMVLLSAAGATALLLKKRK